LPKNIVEERPITIPTAKKILEGLNRELNQFQRRTLEYTTAFMKIEPEKAEKLVEQLIKQLNIEAEEAVQIVNAMPASVEELRVFIPKHKVIETAKLKEALKLMDEYRK